LPLAIGAQLPVHVRESGCQCTAPKDLRQQWQCAGAPVAYAGHARMAQNALPKPAVYVPTGQTAHEVAPVASLNVPAAQAVQALAPVTAM
jgi:hypothetical protein